MEIVVRNQALGTLECDIAIVWIPEGQKITELMTKQFCEGLDSQLEHYCSQADVTGKWEETLLVPTFGKIAARKILFIGIGKASEFTLDKARAISAIALRAARKAKGGRVATTLPVVDKQGVLVTSCAEAFAEGVYQGLYTFDFYKGSEEQKIEAICVLEPDASRVRDIEQGLRKGKILAKAVNVARDLVNHPSNFLTPTKMADIASQIANEYGLQIDIYDRDFLEQQNMGAFLAVAKGSDEPCKLIVMRYYVDKDKETIALIGKGITFDSGGISIKPSEGMGEMKDDMGGAAAVLGAMQAIAQLKPNINVLAVIPATENMPSGHACKPGDIIKSMAGKTIEVISTDAEGRLILVDAVTFALQQGASKVVDIATLTGACVVALGNTASAIVTNNEEWSNRVLTAASTAGEKMWKLPAYEEYKELIKGRISDLKNSGGRNAGAITAGLFIGEFAANVPWVHIDIAGTVTSPKEEGLCVKGATGAGVKTLTELCLQG